MAPTEQQRSTPHFLVGKKIVIAGAGISGLTFTYSLHKLWPSISTSTPPPIVLYERDPSAVPKDREGYSLSLRSDRPSAGIQTLQQMGLLDRMLEVSITGMGGEGGSGDGNGRKGEGGFCIWDREFSKIMKVHSKTPEGCPVAGMRIARADLRRTLVEAVEELSDVEIKWGEFITGTSSSTSSVRAVQVTTSNGNEQSCDVLLAADGSSSKLRTLLRPADILSFAGPTCICGTTSISAHHPSGHDEEFGTAISGDGPALFIAPVDHENMMWSLSWKVDEPPVPRKQPMSRESSEALLDEAKKKGAVYGEKFKEMLDETDLKTLARFNAMDKQPFTHSGTYITATGLEALSGKVIFLGDANHAVSPFAGNGANLALMDGWDFAKCLTHAATLEDAIASYDKLAVGRAKRVISMSHFTIRVMHSSGWMLWVWMCVLRAIRWLFFKHGD